MSRILTASEAQQYAPELRGVVETLSWSYHDLITYAKAGTTRRYLLFQVPAGQAGKTFQDTNMQAPGKLPAGQKFLVESIECEFFGRTAASEIHGVATVLENILDAVAVMTRGWLELSVMGKLYIQDGPLVRFPAQSGFDVQSMISITGGVAAQVETQYIRTNGRLYKLSPPVLIRPQENFAVSLNFPTTVATTVDQEIHVHLNGQLYRVVQ